MKINSILRITVLIPGVIALVVIVSLLISYRQVSEIQRAGDNVRQIRSSIADINHIVLTYIFSRGQDAEAQFATTYDRLNHLISTTELTTPEQKFLLAEVNQDFKTINSEFSLLIAANNNDTAQEEAVFLAGESKLIISIITLSHDADTTAANLRSLVDQGIATTQARTTWLVIIAVALATVLLTPVLLITRRRIMTSLSMLRQGASAVGSGNLDYEIDTPGDDEFTDLSRAFNHMTSDLKNVTASKSDMEKEIEERKKTEDALKASQLRWATTLSSIGDAVIATDTTGKITFMNAVAENLTGWKLTEASGSPIESVFNIINENSREVVESPVARVIREGLVVGLANHTLLVRKDGSEVPIDDSGAPIKYEDGRTKGVVLVFRDITERKKAEREINRNEARLEGLVRIAQHNFLGIQELIDFALEEAIRLTESRIGYIYHYYEDRKEFVLNTWSKEVAEECSILKPQTVYQLEKTGVWGEAVRQRKPILLNDFDGPNPYKKGYPSGHAKLNRFLTIPVINDNKVAAVVGVANKASDYDDSDIRQLTLLMDSVWKIVERRSAEEALKRSEGRFRILAEANALLLTATDPEMAVQTVAVQAMKFLNCDVFFNFMLDERPGRLRLNAYSGISETEAQEMEWLEVGAAICGAVAEQGCRIISNDILNNNDPRAEMVRSYGIQAYACYPLQFEGKTVGTLSFGTKSRTSFTGEELDFMKTVADRLSGAMQRKRSEARVHELAEQWQLTFDSISDMVSIQDKESRLVKVNRAYANAVGISEQELVGRKCHEIIHGMGCPIDNCPHQRTIKTKENSVTEFFEPRLGAYVEASTSPILDAKGDVIGSVHIAKNITARKTAEEILELERSRLISLLNSMEDGVAIMDADFNLEYINPSMEAHYGAVEGLKCYQYFNGRNESCPWCRNEEIFAGKTTRSDVHSNHTGKTYEVTYAPLKNKDGTVSKLTVWHDITERKKVEELKDDFIGMVSHELRTPLTIITGAIHTAMLKGLPEDEKAMLMKDAAGGAEALSDILDNLLELSRYQAKRLVLHNEPVKLRRAVEGIVEKLKVKSPSHQLVNDVPPKIIIMADEVRIERILHNLIENAIKYSPRGGDVIISAKTEDSHVVVGVTDRGMGISPNDQLKLFQPFERLDMLNEGIKGLGLGLVVCSRLVEAHNGRLWLDSAVGKGSTFYFSIPVGK